MPNVPVLNQQGNTTGEIELADSVFAAEVKAHLFHDVVRMQLGARRSANPSPKSRAAVAGGGAKPFRQKGTGRARQGTSRAPHMRGGGVVFGPNGRKYILRLNKKVRRAALRSALSLRLQQSALLVVDKISLEQPKTKDFKGVASALNATHALYVTSGMDETLSLSSRNLHEVKVLAAEGLNVYDILRFPRLVLTKPAALQIQERLKA